MTKTPATGTDTANDNDRVLEARSWVARQLRFEYMLGSLERRISLQLDDVASRRQS